jgi:wyosine [tRNA(Phe)-imidazoG37] synthetase (radical SAM superfamily)
MENLVFGPVPSRRLGRSLGINNIPHKVCSYSCAYCQVGKAVNLQVERREFYSPDFLASQVEKKLNRLGANATPDYITIVPDGEPTLDINLGKLIVKLKSFGFPVAVISNASLINRADVQAELMNADYVSLKVDTVNPATWKMINKPYRELNLGSILDSLEAFSKKYLGTLVTETMLIKDLNDSEEEITNLARHLQKVRPELAYISIPTRPTAFANIYAADEAALAMAYAVFSYLCVSAEFLTGYEGNEFASTGQFTDDILSITAVHPMRMDAVMQLMAKSHVPESSLNMLINKGLLKNIDYNGNTFYVRTFKKLKHGTN